MAISGVHPQFVQNATTRARDNYIGMDMDPDPDPIDRGPIDPSNPIRQTDPDLLVETIDLL
jgi:hypothetical protein